MSAPVDVLAVMDELSEGTTLMTREQCRRVREARDAMAELIEVAIQVDTICDESYGNCSDLHLRLVGMNSPHERLAAALARVGGAA